MLMELYYAHCRLLSPLKQNSDRMLVLTKYIALNTLLCYHLNPIIGLIWLLKIYAVSYERIGKRNLRRRIWPLDMGWSNLHGPHSRDPCRVLNATKYLNSWRLKLFLEIEIIFKFLSVIILHLVQSPSNQLSGAEGLVQFVKTLREGH